MRPALVPLVVSLCVTAACSDRPGRGDADAGDDADVQEEPASDAVPDADCAAGPGVTGVSGPFLEGTTITISGCSFGIKDPAQPLFWDRVDNQPAYTSLETGAMVPTGDGLPWRTNGSDAFVNNVKFYQGGESRVPGGWAYWIPSTEAPKGKGYLRGHELDLPEDSGLYVSWWHKVDNCTPGEYASTPLIALRPDETDTSGRLSWTFTQWFVTDVYNEAESTFSSLHTAWWVGMEPCDATWSHYEVQLAHQGPTAHGIQGTATLRRDREVRCAAGTGGAPTFCADRPFEAASVFDRIWVIGLDISEPDRSTVEPTNTWFTEIYVDTTQARVLVGDSAHFSSVSHFELQIPVAWSEDRIDVEAHPGSFGPGERVWLYVVDAGGNANAFGYPVSTSG